MTKAQPKLTLKLLVVLSFCLMQFASLHAQGTRADYERADFMPHKVRSTVLNQRLELTWAADDSWCWFREQLPKVESRYMLLHTATGKRELAFDHDRLAAGLSKARGGREVDARSMRILDMEFAPDFQSMTFLYEKKFWRCNLKTYEVERSKTGPREKFAELPPLDRPLPSRPSNEWSTLTIVNETQGELSMSFNTPEGKNIYMGKIAAGEREDVPTRVGDVWEFEDVSGKVRGRYLAPAEQRRIVIREEEATKPQNPHSEAEEDDSADDAPATRTERPRLPDQRPIIRNHNVYWRAHLGEPERALTTDGTPENSYSGRIRSSPDGKYFVVMRTQAAEKHPVRMIESSPKDQVQPKLYEHDYLKPGDRVEISKPALFDAEKGKRIELDDTLYANPWSITEFRWEADSSRFTFLFNQRGHQALRLIAVEVSGKTTAIVNEESKTFVNYSGNFFLERLPKTNELIWMSERDGWNHLYLYDAKSGEVKNQITRGDWVVRGVERVDAEKRQIWFKASGLDPEQDPYYVHYCRIDFDGQNLVRLTRGDGTHTIVNSPEKKFFVDTWSRVDEPPVHELRRTSDGKLIAELLRTDLSRLAKTGWRAPERFTAKGRDGKTDIYGIICRPSNFDPNKKYPVIEKIYAGPHSAFVPKSFKEWQGNLQTYAELGFIVVQIDGMGTSHRSKAFHDVCWQNLADAGFPDRIAWLKAAAEHEPAMDLARVGIFGGSAGGQNALGALLLHGDFYKAAVADCGCHDNRMDKIWWNEQWMGYPIGKHYEEQSNVTLAKNLKGKLLLTVGELDQNVDPASTMQVVNALIKADKDFDLLVVPGAGHGIGESPYADRRRRDFFVRHLLGVEPRN